MKKLILKVDKVDKSRITTREFKTRDGEEVSEREFAINLFDLKTPKLLKDTDSYTFQKVGFATEVLSKEEVDAGAEAKSVGDIVEFVNKS